jgi:hypothetical protein
MNVREINSASGAGHLRHSFISKKQEKLVQIKRIIKFVKADVSREDSFSRPVKFKPLYQVDYKRSEKIVRAQVGQQESRI